jgi:hypothetical protein
MTDEANRTKAQTPEGAAKPLVATPKPSPVGSASGPGAPVTKAQALGKPTDVAAIDSAIVKGQPSTKAKTPEAKVAKAAPARGARMAVITAVVVGAGATIAATAFVPEARVSGPASYVGLALGACSLALAIGALFVRRKSPRKIGLPAIAAVVGAAACALTGLIALQGRTPSTIADEAPAVHAFRVGEAQAHAHVGALFGLAGIPGALVGGLGIWLGVRARQRQRAAAPPANLGVESIPLGWAALSGVGLAAVAGVGVDVVALASEVVRVEHPHVHELRAIADAVKRSDIPTACDALETALAPDYVPPEVLDQELPDYREIAHRCLTLRIDALPKGIACATQAGKLLASPIVHVVNAEDRIKHACDSAL